VPRQQVLRHLEGRGLDWREDPTNADRSLLRNRVRHELLPYLESRFNPEIRETLARTAALLADEAELIDRVGRELGGGRREGDAFLLSRRELSAAPRAQARAAIRSALEATGGLLGVGAAPVERLLDLASAKAPSGRRLALPGDREALFRFDTIRIGPRTSPPAAFSRPLRVPGRVELPGGQVLVARPAEGPAASGEQTAVVAVPEGPLVVRTRQPGDRVRRHGRDVSLKRFLMERRVPADLRSGLPLVASGGRVLWVAGEAPESLPGRRFVRLRLERTR
jgi:tRNA(Ile)-lysidine synthase